MTNDENTGWELVEPFDIDDGSLNGVPPELAFTLGVEWVRWWMRIRAGNPRSELCLSENAARIVKMLERHGFFCEDRPYDFATARGICSAWRFIWVGDKKTV